MLMRKLHDFAAYTNSLELFDLVVDGRKHMQQISDTQRLRSEFSHNLVISRGSAAESMGRYRRMKHWLPKDIVNDRVNRCDEIISILTTTIAKLRKDRA